MLVQDVVDILAAPMTFSYVLGEVRELLKEIRKRSIFGVVEEYGDVSVCWWCWVSRSIPVASRIRLGSAARISGEKFRVRMYVWELIFGAFGAPFKKSYLINGGNYLKDHEVITALELAGVHSPDLTRIAHLR